MDFVHLHVHSPFSFLDGGSEIRNLVKRAKEYGMSALALTDHNSLAGAVQFQKECEKEGLKAIHGAEVTLESGGHLVLLARGQEGYHNLSRLLTKAHLVNERLQPMVSIRSLWEYQEGLIALSGCRRGEVPSLLLKGKLKEAKEKAELYRDIFGGRFYLEIQNLYIPGDVALNRKLKELGEETGIRLAGTNNVHYLDKEDFPVHDLLTCIRLGLTLEEVHQERRLNAENYLKSTAKMYEVLADYPEAIENTLAIADLCEPGLDMTKRYYPAYLYPKEYRSATAYLKELVYAGAKEKYGRISRTLRERIEHELFVIDRLKYSDYFLLVWDVVQHAKEKGIRYAGRGSAADSVIAYSLSITEVDAFKRGLLFERFISLERAESPDIDIDFDARYRDDVSAYVYVKYGERHVAAVATYHTFQARSALRELGKVLGFSAKEADILAKRVPYYLSDMGDLFNRVPEIKNMNLSSVKYEQLLYYAKKIIDLPRHLGTHLGGLVITNLPVTDLSPLQKSAKGVNVIGFDKRAVEDLGLLKLDLLSLRTMSAIEDSIKIIRDLDYEKIPLDDKETYKMLHAGETVGVFQLESAAQRALQSKLKADNFEDIVASLALIRPGPIQGNMVDPFIARRKGKEKISYLHPDLEPILKKTYGVVLFQEQVIEIASVIAGFTPGESDQLRRVMTHARSSRDMEEIGGVFLRKAQANGVSIQTAKEIFSYIAGYASYGFNEAHATAFAYTAYKTAYLLRHYPAEYYCSLLNHQPMGYYPVNTLCLLAKQRGIQVLPLDINESEIDFSVEKGNIRIGLKQLKGLREKEQQAIITTRSTGRYLSYKDFIERLGSRVCKDSLSNLVKVGAFDSLEENRRALLWQKPVADASPLEKWAYEIELTGIESQVSFMGLTRDRLKGFTLSTEVKRKIGKKIWLAGWPIRPHRPPTKSGKVVVFFSLQDEVGLAEVTMFTSSYEKYGQLIFGEHIPLGIYGEVFSRDGAISVNAEVVKDLRDLLTRNDGNPCRIL